MIGRGEVQSKTKGLCKPMTLREVTTYGNTAVAADNGHNNVFGQGEVTEDLSNEC